MVTTSGTFVTLVFAISAFVLGKDHAPSGGARWATVVALGLFVVAGILGIVGNALWSYDVASGDTLREMITNPHWKDSEVDARNVVATANVKTVETLRSGSDTKATIITVALGFQVAAITALAVALLTEVT